MFEEDLREGAAKVCSIDVDLSELGQVDFLASWTKYLEARSF
jgi:hypothetical protein